MTRGLKGAAVLAMLAAGTVAAVAGDGPGAATRSGTRKDARLAIAQRVAARPAGRSPGATESLRYRDPRTGDVLAVTAKPVRRPKGPVADRAQWCLDVSPLATLAGRRFSATAACRPVRPDRSAGLPLVLATSNAPDASTQISGFVPPGVRRLTVAGLGPPTRAPVGSHGEWLIAVAPHTRAVLTITAESRDGTTRFERVRIPPGPIGATTAETPDPVDDSTWAVSAGYRTAGDRKGQTGAQFHHLDPAGDEAGFGEPLCGDLHRRPVVLDTVRRGPGPHARPGSRRVVQPRLIVWGVASARVRSLLLTAPGVRRDVAIDEVDRGFIAVLPASFSPGDVVLRVTTEDGGARSYRAPRRIGALPEAG